MLFNQIFNLLKTKKDFQELDFEYLGE